MITLPQRTKNFRKKGDKIPVANGQKNVLFDEKQIIISFFASLSSLKSFGYKA